MEDLRQQVARAIAQCLTWNTTLDSKTILDDLQVAAATLRTPFDTLKTTADIEAFAQKHPALWDSKIGLVYGGATKIKQYVFESADLQEIRGASALLDRINLIDLPAFFGAQASHRFSQCQQATSYCQQVQDVWLQAHFPHLVGALTPEMIVYSTGGNILAFCPAELVDDLADAIEKRYTVETLTANACAVGDTFYPLEIYLGLLKDPIGTTPWLDTVQANRGNVAVQTYFGFNTEADTQAVEAAFRQRKGFSELVGKLANQFNQRRSGYDNPGSSRPSRRYPPMFETHPYVIRDDSDRRSAVVEVDASDLPDTPKFSEATARKRRVGQITKREEAERQQWYTRYGFSQHWNATAADDSFGSWVEKFETFLREHHLVEHYDPRLDLFNSAGQPREPNRREARSLTEIGDASNGFVAYIYADGNNMGAYIRDRIKTPEDYERFSQDVFEATEQSVYWALAHHVHPYEYTPDAKSSRVNTRSVWIHPFEIITIGGDDVLLVVPANIALEVAKAIGDRFEELLVQTGRYTLDLGVTQNLADCHRYRPESASQSESRLSISSGMLITAANTPIYYADKLVSQLLKSAKKKAKTLKDKGYFGGTVDFLTLKAVTMISSNIEAFRQEGLTVRFKDRQQELKLYAAPYTLHELDGLIKTVQAVKQADFPKSQLYQVRSLLERGKRTAMLNYRYFSVRLQKKADRDLLKEKFDNAWCGAKTNGGNLAPWMTLLREDDAGSTPEPDKTVYETLWRELVELYPFIQASASQDNENDPTAPAAASPSEVTS